MKKLYIKPIAAVLISAVIILSFSACSADKLKNIALGFLLGQPIQDMDAPDSDGGISMFNTGIISDDIFLRVDHTIWKALSPQLSGSLTFKLIENSDEDIHLPFGIEYYYTNVNKKCALTVDDLYSRDFQLVISKYPINQRINIVRDAS